MTSRINGMLAVVLVAVLGTSALQAHHSSSMFEPAKPVWVKGRVLRYEVVNPHVLVTLEEQTAEGPRMWVVEGPAPNGLSRVGIGEHFLHRDDTVEFCGFPLRDGITMRMPAVQSGMTQSQMLHGHLAIAPDGKMRAWGPYGKLQNCVRPADQLQLWLDFLTAQPRALEFWCRGAGLLAPVRSEALPLVTRINGALGNPCQ